MSQPGEGADLPVAHGRLPPWPVGDLPAPKPFTMSNVFTVIGPGAILLAASIGGGEWLVGPAAAVRYGTSVMWIATIAIVLQTIFNLEGIRYTLYTGEPVLSGFMRLSPGSGFWSVFYGLLALLQLGWPALALSTAGTVFSMSAGRLPGADPADLATMQWIAMAILTLVAVILMFGGTIERMLEIASWGMLAYIFGFLVLVNVVFVPFEHSIETLKSFLVVQSVGGVMDWALLGALVGTAASGGIGNLTVTNWIRDKGWGMGAKVGAIESAVGGRHAKLSPIGMVFRATPENIRRWHTWWRYVYVDQVAIWAVCCFVGLFLNVNLATSLAPAGASLQGIAAGAYQAQYMAEHLWAGFWMLALLNGFWILFSTCLGNTDIFVRTVTDLLWTGSAGARRVAGGRPARIYYPLLAIFTLWSFYAIRMAGPFALFQIFANMAGLILAIAAVQIFRVNRRFLPPALRPPLWREAMLIGCSLFYAFFAARAIWSLL